MYYISRFTWLHATFTVFDNLYYILHLTCYDIILFLQAKQKLLHDPIGMNGEGSGHWRAQSDGPTAIIQMRESRDLPISGTIQRIWKQRMELDELYHPSR